ncbi:DgyrCDS3786 [Dimorphilus gyrociliatus]|uniref:ATP synthase subunit g n=1 Tax=Dimorphilus gyrociliatus TaxID=2664684 RepID=A0A7I8VF03_9ANNE|nr:DgyrCDS3786 [Dimorphilus gyrociliatus]
MAGAVAKLGQTIVGSVPKVTAFAKPRLTTFWQYARVELRPPTPAEIPEVSKGLTQLINSAKSGKWKKFTVKEATVNTLVGIEVAMWFFIGECIGKGSLVGYQIPGACHFDAEL